MPVVFRVTARDGRSIGEAGTLEEAIELARDVRPGRYRIEKLSLDPATGEVRAWDLGAIIKGRRGRIKLDLPPWLD